jgi:hypothetical protein
MTFSVKYTLWHHEYERYLVKNISLNNTKNANTCKNKEVLILLAGGGIVK